MLRFLYVSAQIALRALNRNRFRTTLTMLGVVIGVAAVIAMVALGSGARGSVETSLKSAGTNIIQVSAGNFMRGGESMNIATGLGSATTLTVEDADAIRQIAARLKRPDFATVFPAATLRLDPCFAPLRGDAEFAKVIAEAESLQRAKGVSP